MYCLYVHKHDVYYKNSTRRFSHLIIEVKKTAVNFVNILILKTDT